MKKTTLLIPLFFLWGYFSINPLTAQVLPFTAKPTIFTIEQLEEAYFLKHEVGILLDSGFEIDIQNIEKQFQNAPFQELDKLNFSLETHQYYWGKLVLKNRLPNAPNYTEWVLQFPSSISCATSHAPFSKNLDNRLPNFVTR